MEENPLHVDRSDVNILVEAPGGTETALARCIDLVSASTSISAVLIVSYNKSARAIIDQWETQASEIPDHLAIIEVIGSEEAPEERCSINTEEVVVTSIPSSDLSEILSAVDDFLSSRKNEEKLMLWFDSISPLLESAGEKMAFRFLHSLLSQVGSTSARAYYVLDPTTLEAQIQNSVAYLVDRVIEL